MLEIPYPQGGSDFMAEYEQARTEYGIELIVLRLATPTYNRRVYASNS